MLGRALSDVNQAIGLVEKADFLSLKDSILTEYTSELKDGVKRHLENKNYDLALTNLKQAMSLDPQNEELKSMKTLIENKQKEEQNKFAKMGTIIIAVLIVIVALVFLLC